MSKASDENQIVSAYASALFAAAGKQDAVRTLIEESQSLLKTIKGDRMFQDFLLGPQISRKQKRDLVERVFKDRLHPLLINLLKVTIDNQRTELIDEILGEYREIAERAEGIFPAKVRTARALDFDQKLKLKGTLENYTGKTLRIEYEVDPDLIGGVVFRYHDQLIDGSIREQLTRVRNKLLGTLSTAA